MKNLLTPVLQVKLNRLTTHKIIHSPYAQVLLGSWLIVLGTKISIPFYPVPMSLQTFTIALISLLCSYRIATGAVLLYIGYGVAHLPVFSKGILGIAALMGPTAGYIVGFVVMAMVISLLMERYPNNNPTQRFLITLLGGACVMALGILRLIPLYGWDIAIKVGFIPFLLSEPVKMMLATQLSIMIQQKFNR